jgi:hypothetical protein
MGGSVSGSAAVWRVRETDAAQSSLVSTCSWGDAVMPIRCKHPVFPAVAILAVLAMLAMPGPLRASGRVTLPAHGGAGGQPFRNECPEGHYLVGFEARVGAFMDQIAPVCARWASRSGRLEHPQVGRAAGGTGGQPWSPRCPVGSVVSSILFDMTIDGRTRQPAHVDWLTALCVEPLSGRDFGTPQPVSPAGLRSRSDPLKGGGSCGANERAVGVHGRAQWHVDALGLICGPAPQTAKPIQSVGPRPGGQPDTDIKHLSQPPPAPPVSTPVRPVRKP